MLLAMIEGKRKVLNLINKKSISIDIIKLMLNLKENNIEKLLLNIELEGKIKQVSGLFSLSEYL